MGPSSGFLLVLIGISFILTHAGPVPDSECPPDQIYYECGSPCSMMCAKSDPRMSCIDMCMTGCFCKPGFTFLEGSNKTQCVPCEPTFPVSERECPPDQIYYECGSPCSMMCAKSDPREPCNAMCMTGCFCKPGFKFLVNNENQCVPCEPTFPVSERECPPDQIYYECGSPCSMMCAKSDPRMACIDMCITGCFCKPGFTFLEGSNKTQCVPCEPTFPDSEMGVCPPDQIYYECGSPCSMMCANSDPREPCIDRCMTGCFCKPGFKFLEGSNETQCVPCEPTFTDRECPPDQIYYECGSPCSMMCAENNPDELCIDMCMTGCFCPPGFAFLEGSNKTKCVPCK